MRTLLPNAPPIAPAETPAMARLARADLVDPLEVAAYHCIHRYVRRSFLCGKDPYNGRNYDHRKA